MCYSFSLLDASSRRFYCCDAFNPNTYPEDYDLAFRFYKAGYKCIPCNNVLLIGEITVQEHLEHMSIMQKIIL